MAPLPVVGLQVVLQGVAAFGSGAKTVDGFAQNLGRSMFILQRSTVGAFDGIDKAFQSVEKTTAKLSASQAKLLATQTATYATLAQRAADGARAEIAASNQARDVIVSNSRTRVATVIADANRAAAAERAAAAQVLQQQIANARETARIAKADLRQQTTTGAINIRQNAAPGPAGRAAASIDIAQLRRDAAEQQAIIQATQVAEVNAAKNVAQQRTVLANQTRTAVITAAQQTAQVEIASAQASAREVNAASLQKSAAAIRSAEAQAAAAAQAAEAQAAQSAAIGAAAQAAAAVVIAAIVGITSAYAALVIVSTKSASDFERQFALVQGATGATSAQVGKLKQAIDDLKDTPTSIKSLTEAIYDLSTAGASVEDIIGGGLKAVNDLILASGNRLSADTAAITIATTTNAFKNYQKAGAAAADITDVIAYAAQNSAQSFESVGTAVQRSAGTLARSGVSLQEYGALVTLVGQQIRDGSTAGSALQRVFLDLQDPTDKQIKLMKQFNISLYDSRGNLRPTRDFILGLNKAFGEGAIAAGKLTRAQRDAALAGLFEQNAIRAVNAILDGGIEKFDEYTASSKGAAKSLIDIQLETVSAKYDEFTKAVNKASIELGTNFLPPLKDTIETLTKFVSSIPAKEIGAFTVQLPKMAGAIKDMATNSALLVPAIAGVAAVIAVPLIPLVADLTLKMAQLAVVTLAAAAPYIALGLAVGAFVLIFNQERDSLDKTVGDIGNTVGQLAGTLYTYVTTTLGSLLGAISSAVSGIGGAVSSGLSGIGGVIAGAFNGIVNAVAGFLAPLLALWDSVWTSISASAVEKLDTAYNDLSGVLLSIFNGVKSFLTPLVTFWNENWERIYNIVGDKVSQMAADLGKALDGIFQLVVGFGQLLLQNWDKIWKAVAFTALGPLGLILKALHDFANLPGIDDTQFAGFAKGVRDAEANIAATTAAMADNVGSAVDGTLKAVGEAAAGIGEVVGKNASDVGNFFQKAFEFAGPAAAKFAEDVGNAFNGFAQRTGVTFGKIGADTQALIDKLKYLASLAFLPPASGNVLNPTAKGGGGGGDEGTDTGFPPPDPKKFQEAFDKLVALARDTSQAISKLAEDAQQKFAAIASKAADAVADAQREISKSVSEAIRDAAKSIADLNRDAAQGLADRARTDALQRQQDAANVARDKGLADADHAHQRELEADDEFYQKQQDAQNRAFDQLQKDADIAHAREIDNLNIVHERELDDARRAFDEQQRLALSAFTDQQEADQRQFQQRADLANLEYQHEIDIDKAIADARRKLNDELEKETKDRAQKLEEENERHLNTLQQAQNQAIIDAENRRHAKETGRINDVGNDTQSKAQEELQATIDNLNAQYEAQLKDYERRLALDEQARKFREDQEAALAAFRKAQEADVLKYQQDAEAAALVRRRQQEDDERLYRKQQDDAELLRREQREADALVRRQGIEDAEIARKRAQDDADRAYSQQQDAAQRALQDQLAREALARRIAEINAERDAKLRALDQELQARLQKIERERQQEVAAFLADLQQRIKIIRQEFIDKLPAILEAGGAAIAPIVNGFLDLISAQLAGLENQAISTANAVTGAAIAGVGAIAGAIMAANAAISGTQMTAADTASQRAVHGSTGTNTGRVYQDAPQGQTFDLVPQYAEGGIVAGPTGAPQFAIVHGGELIIPAAALRAMVTPAVGGSSTRNVNYNVEANYKNVQSEGSVRQDMQALVALSRH